MQLTCPKCDALMRRYERNGIVVDQCSACKGVFLDRGELEHLIDTEKWVSGTKPGDSMPEFHEPPSPSSTPDATPEKTLQRRTLMSVLFGD
ncbi:zf-TFIIB domain-containing protein [Glycomyces buryatensis]|uniref:Transcription factor zinc-finger domain-containing protein n=1 Tax=Glycomyces buryatensis TaxID=2570927 RepID=A0A4S8QIF4_9ACTN|nr:zf-TFIIB domain-containing protein [Glycomyces buryatensis]THV40504.1 hypothetical protein FAB82_14625 [Glycomyces buryatensis]